jgi:hypothetical protein
MSDCRANCYLIVERRTVMRSLIVLCLVLALLIGSLAVMACGGKKEETTSGAAVEETSQPEEAAAQGGRGWGDVPEYRGASISQKEGQMTVPAAARGEYQRAEHRWYETDDSWEQVHEYYLKEMPRKGWMKLFAMKYPEGSGISVWRKDDGDRGCVVSTGVSRDGVTHIGLLLNEGKK